MNNCLTKARPHLSSNAYEQILERSRVVQAQGLPEKDAIAQAAQELLAQVQEKLEQPRQSMARWQVIEDGVKSEAEAQKIIDRKKASGWDGYDFKISPSEFHEDGSFQVESLKQQPKQSAARDVTQTEAFKRWFGDSKVVDTDGKPLVVYHGSNKDITEVDPKAAIASLGFHVGTMEQAEKRLKVIARGRGKDGLNVMPLYVSIKNPLRLTDPKDWHPERVRAQLERAGAWDEAASAAWAAADYRLDPNAANEEYARREAGLNGVLVAAMRRAGHDGVVYGNRHEGPGDSYIAFSPEQIKSAIGNSGAFDPGDADITRSAAREVVETPEFKKWFGSSKVTDADGQPKVMYHGTYVRKTAEEHGRSSMTMGDIHVFDRMFAPKALGRRPNTDQIGSWFSDSPSRDGGAGMYGDTLYPVYLKVEKPIEWTFAELLDAAEDKLSKADRKAGKKPSTDEIEALREELKYYGYDGIRIVHDPKAANGSTEFAKQDAWIVLEPEQVKSAIGNNGNFDPADADITQSTRREFLIATAAALAVGDANADVTLGRAKPLDEKVANSRVSPEVEKILTGNGRGTTNIEGHKALRQAMGKIAAAGPQELRALADGISKLLPNDTLMLSVEGKDMNAHGVVEFSPVVRMRLFDGPKGISQGLRYSTLLHESLHVAVLARYKTLSTGVIRRNDAVLGMPAPAAAKAMEQFTAVWNEFGAAARPALRGMDTNSGLGLAIDLAAADPDEFFARALTQPELQAWMAKQEYQGKTLLARFIDWVKSSLLGFKKEGTSPSWLDAALLASDDLLKAMGGDPADFKRFRASESLADRRGKSEEIQRSAAREVETMADATWTDKRISAVLDEFAGFKDGEVKAYVAWVAPEDFLAATTPFHERNSLERERTKLNEEKLAAQSQPIFLKGDIKRDAYGTRFVTWGHEGRHRMMALRDAGVGRVPVVFNTGGWHQTEKVDRMHVQEQTWGNGLEGERGFEVGQIVPIAYENKSLLQEIFGGDGDVRFSASRPTFYSQLELAIEEVPERLQTMAAPQWKLWLDANAAKLGVKKEEIEWSGIKDFLAMKGKEKVSIGDLRLFLSANNVDVQDVVLGGFDKFEEIDRLNDKLDPHGYRVELDGSDGDTFFFFDRSDKEVRYTDLPSNVRSILDAEEKRRGGASKFQQYTLPGGQNYREVLITLPAKPTEREVDRAEAEKILDAGGVVAMEYDGNKQEMLAGRVGLMALRKKWPTTSARFMVQNEDKSYRSSHWDAPNVLAHLRVDDRTDAEGKRVLFINEIQSDWAQEGRKKGFKSKGDDDTAVEAALRQANLKLQQIGPEEWIVENDIGDTVSEGETRGAALRGAIELFERAGATLPSNISDRSLAGSLPAAPFVADTKSWVSLALKRAIMMAVEGGYDRLAFVTGEQAADFFDLSKQISGVRFEDNNVMGVGAPDMDGAPGSGMLYAYGMNGEQVIAQFVQTPVKDLPDMIGKEAAEKLLNLPGEDQNTKAGTRARVRELKGVDLKVGGEGMRGFYDKIVPQVANDVLKKIGGEKVGEVKLGVPQVNPTSQMDVLNARGITLEQWNEMPHEERDRILDEDFAKGRQPDLASTQPGFSITPKMRETVEGGLPLFSTARVRDMDVGFGYKVADFFDSSKKVSWWDKTVGTPYHLAQKHPTFKRVYDAIQNFISDVSKYATRAADLAPNILPKLEHLKDILKSPLSAADVEALGDPIFQGTLVYTRDIEGKPVEAEDVGSAGIVWTKEELKSMWKLDDRQIGLYREFRSAANKSIADLAVTGMLRLAGDDADGVRGRVLAASTAKSASEILADHLGWLAANDPKRANTLQNTARVIKEQADEARGLMARGYAPLSRFGDFTVYAPGIGEHGYFEMFETERDANRRRRQLELEFPKEKISVGTMSKEGYKLFKGVTPETLALFGDALGLEGSTSDRESQVFQEYLKMAKSTRSAMKRLIKRKGVDGYSNDVGRVLAGFVYSNARQASTNLHAGEMLKSANEVPEGDLKDHAIQLLEYAQNPKEEAQAIRGMLFANYIGGSVASALTNLTQSLTTTWPTLSMHFGVAKAGKAMADAVEIHRKGAGADDDLAKALKRAEEEGITAPQETHQLMAQAQGRGSLKSGDGTVLGDQLAKLSNGFSKAMFAWGKMFSWAEVVNREIAFAAAYKLAREQRVVVNGENRTTFSSEADAQAFAQRNGGEVRPAHASPYEFAAKIVADTQFTMNKGNNPVWARGPVGATLFTFRKFMVMYLEGLARMWGNGPEGKKAFALSLGIMFLMAGAGGFPFADDADDVIDAFAQRVLGKSWSTKQAKKEFFAGILGDAGADFVMGGLSSLPGFPIDFSGRLGLGNVVPGTGLLTKKADHSRDVAEIGGAAADFGKRMLTAAGEAAAGNVAGAVESALPVALTNVMKAKSMAELGYYQDLKGRKVVDTTAAEAALKAIGFQPQAVKKVQDATQVAASLIAQNKIRETEIADLWARGRAEKKPELVEQARAQLKAWNDANPDSPIDIDAAQINKRVKAAMMDKAQRVGATAPKAIRAAVKAELTRELGQE